MRDDDFTKELLSGTLMRRGYTYLAANSGKVVAIITAVVATLVTFTDVAFTGFGTTEFTTTLIVMLIASYLIYFSLEDAGKRLGEESEEYRAAMERYLDVRSKIKPEHISQLREYLSQYCSEELRYRRHSFLAAEGFSPDEYRRYKEGEKVPLAASLVFNKAGRMKQVALSPASLLSRQGGEWPELTNPELSRRAGSLLRLVPSTVCMFFTASVILTAKPDLNASVIIEGVLKLSALPIVGFRGYSAGYAYAVGPGCQWLETKTRLLTGFVDKLEGREAYA